MEQSKLDLHLHSCMSDGSCRPAEVVRLAKEAGVVMLALTDHDTLDGLAEAQEAAEESGLTFLPGVESFRKHFICWDLISIRRTQSCAKRCKRSAIGEKNAMRSCCKSLRRLAATCARGLKHRKGR